MSSKPISGKPWWIAITAQELYDLRKRLLGFVAESFGRELQAEHEDLVQHALLALIRNKERVLPDNDGLFRYVRRVAKNAALDRLRSAGTRTAAPRNSGDVPIPLDQPSVPAHLQMNEEIRKIRKIFCELDDLDRLVLWSYVVDGESINAIARKLNVSWHQIAHLIEQSLAHFRRHLS